MLLLWTKYIVKANRGEEVDQIQGQTGNESILFFWIIVVMKPGFFLQPLDPARKDIFAKQLVSVSQND
jgi:hypothetical protein